MDIQEIKKYMKEQKISYEKLAQMTNLSVSTITKIFGGFAKYPRIDTIEAIEKALGFTNKKLNLSDEKIELLALFDEMSSAQKSRFIAYGEGLLGKTADISRKNRFS